MQSVKSSIIIIIFFFIALFVYSKIAGPITFSVNNINTDNSSPFQTSGTGEATGTPDKASISLGVTANGTTAEEAKNAANSTINKVISDLKKLGIKESDIKTSNFSVYGNPSVQPLTPDSATNIPTIYPYRTPAPGFTASANLDVKTDSIDLANRAIDAATSDGANSIGGVNFTFDDATQKKLENEARIKAVADAKQQAQNLASAAGIKLGRIINITEHSNGFPVPLAANAKAGGTSDVTNLQPGENTVTVNVTLTFETN